MILVLMAFAGRIRGRCGRSDAVAGLAARVCRWASRGFSGLCIFHCRLALAESPLL